MKMEIINDKNISKLIRGKVGVGQKLVSVHKGKILHVVLVTTKIKTLTEISWDSNLVVPKSIKNRIRHPISKGILSNSNIVCITYTL